MHFSDEDVFLGEEEVYGKQTVEDLGLEAGSVIDVRVIEEES